MKLKTAKEMVSEFARPDAGEVSSTSYYSFNPVGGGMFEFGSSTMGLNIKGDIGTVKVSTT